MKNVHPANRTAVFSVTPRTRVDYYGFGIGDTGVVSATIEEWDEYGHVVLETEDGALYVRTPMIGESLDGLAEQFQQVGRLDGEAFFWKMKSATSETQEGPAAK